MTLNLDSWLGISSGELAVMSASERAVLEWRRISDRPSSIELTRGAGQTSVKLAAQTVRIESDNTATWRDGALVTQGVQKVVVFGVKDHPTITDTDIQRSDRFSIDGVIYEVISIMTPPGEVQAICEARRGS